MIDPFVSSNVEGSLNISTGEKAALEDLIYAKQKGLEAIASHTARRLSLQSYFNLDLQRKPNRSSLW
jgi:hypothetical protein